MVLLKSTWVQEEAALGNWEKYKLNDSQPTMYQNLCEIAKEGQRGDFWL